MSDAEWLRGLVASGWNDDLYSPEVKAMFTRVANRLDRTDALLSECRRAIGHLQKQYTYTAGTILQNAISDFEHPLEPTS